MGSEPDQAALYRERAMLLAVLGRLFGAVLSYNDPLLPDWPVLFVETPEGQLSWHIAPGDLDVLGSMTVVPHYPWDRHTTEQKYERLRKLIPQLPKLTYADPVYGRP